MKEKCLRCGAILETGQNRYRVALDEDTYPECWQTLGVFCERCFLVGALAHLGLKFVEKEAK
jgi:hypothetical protein